MGHHGQYGHQFLDFEIDSEGRLKYHNNSAYKHEQMIRKVVYVSSAVVNELRRIICESGILECGDGEWPKSNYDSGRQQLLVRVGSKEIKLCTSKLGTFADVLASKDPKGLTAFFYLVQDIKCLVFSLVTLHFRVFSFLHRSNPYDSLFSFAYL